MTSPSVSSSTSTGASVRAGTIRDAISAANAAFMAAFAAADAAGIASCYTAEAQLLPHQSDVVNGRSAIEAFWQGALGMGLTGATLETVEIYHSAGAPIATEVGRYRLTAGDQVADFGKYVVIWQQESDGQWCLYRDIWTSSQAPATT